MSDSLAGPLPADSAADVGGMPTTNTIPRRVMRARREAAEALGLAFEGQVPAWSVAPAPAYGSAVPLDVDTFGVASSR